MEKIYLKKNLINIYKVVHIKKLACLSQIMKINLLLYLI